MCLLSTFSRATAGKTRHSWCCVGAWAGRRQKAFKNFWCLQWKVWDASQLGNAGCHLQNGVGWLTLHSSGERLESPPTRFHFLQKVGSLSDHSSALFVNVKATLPMWDSTKILQISFWRIEKSNQNLEIVMPNLKFSYFFPPLLHPWCIIS